MPQPPAVAVQSDEEQRLAQVAASCLFSTEVFELVTLLSSFGGRATPLDEGPPAPVASQDIANWESVSSVERRVLACVPAR
jgi:hypothetical protein